MFNILPEDIQNQILYYLETDNFKAAKKIRDAFFEDKLVERLPCFAPSLL